MVKIFKITLLQWHYNLICGKSSAEETNNNNFMAIDKFRYPIPLFFVNLLSSFCLIRILGGNVFGGKPFFAQVKLLIYFTMKLYF